jgi:hypothetical protein
MKRNLLSSYFYIFLVVLLLSGAGGGKQPKADENKSNIPEGIRQAVRHTPENMLVGVGAARAESDGESILLAENHAREEIARQLNAMLSITNYRSTNYYDESTSTIEEDFIQAVTSVTLSNSIVIRREKDSNGYWWCVVLLSNNAPRPPRMTELYDIIKFNESNFPDTANIRIVDEIPDWVNNPNNILENVVHGIGAAKMDNIDAAVYMAMERARRSLARSLSANVNSVWIELHYPNEDKYYNELFGSITSEYDNTALQLELYDIAKTKDGTLWIMLLCPLMVSPFPPLLPPPSDETLRRMNEAFDRYLNGKK